jgi:hypothetical protein
MATKSNSIKEIIEKISQKNPIVQRGQFLAKLENKWPDIIGAKLAAQCNPEKIQNNILWLSTASAVWNQQIYFYHRQIIDKINKYFQKNIISEIRCLSTKMEKVKKGAARKRISVLPAELKENETFFKEELKEDHLRASLTRIFCKAKKLEKNYKYRTQICERCGNTYRGTNPKECVFCEEKNLQQKQSKIIRILKEAPWADYEGVKQQGDGISERVFYQTKNSFRAKIKEKVYLGIYTAGKNRAVDKKILKGKIMDYVSLRTGLTPDKINDKIIAEVYGKRKIRLLKMKGVRV